VFGAAIAIAVPARDEAERLPVLLNALAKQQDNPPFTLALYFDNCVDGSEALVGAMADRLPFPIIMHGGHSNNPPSAGVARRRAMALAASVVPAGTLMTTDADSAPAADWIAANLRGLQAADIVAGQIVQEAVRTSPVQAQLAAYLDRLHRFRRLLDPVPWEATMSHHWTSAASLAMRSDTYRAIGGFPAIPSGEDAGLADTAARGGYRIRRDAAVRVVTSSRRSGRATTGFAACLSSWDCADRPPEVADPEDEAWRYARHAEARRLHSIGCLDDFAASLGLSLAEVEQVAGECRDGEAFAARIVGAPPGGMRPVPLPRAEHRLATLEQAHLPGAA
jgi:hypothetical protein